MDVQKVITMISSMSYIELFRGAGLEHIVSPQSSTATNILRFVRSTAYARGAEIESLYRLMEGRVEALEFAIKENIEEITEIPLKEMKLKKGVLIACIVRADKVIIPSGGDMICRGDRVIIVTTIHQMKEIKEIIK